MNDIFENGFPPHFPEDSGDHADSGLGHMPESMPPEMPSGQPENTGSKPDEPGSQASETLANLPDHPDGGSGFEIPQMPPEIEEFMGGGETLDFSEMGPFEGLPEQASEEASQALENRGDGSDGTDQEAQGGPPQGMPSQSEGHFGAVADHMPDDMPVDVPVV